MSAGHKQFKGNSVIVRSTTLARVLWAFTSTRSSFPFLVALMSKLGFVRLISSTEYRRSRKLRAAASRPWSSISFFSSWVRAA